LSHPSIRKFISLLALCGFSNALIFDCKYSLVTYRTSFTLYTCKAKVITYNNANFLHGVTGNHWNNYSNSKVEALFVEHQQVLSLPKGIAQSFPNLKYLSVIFSQLKTISKDDLKQFPNLRVLDLYANQLEALDGDLFIANPNIEHVDFQSNKIKNVGTGLLHPLTKLTYASFYKNLCINKQASLASEIASLQQDLETKCPPTTDMIIKNWLSKQ